MEYVTEGLSPLDPNYRAFAKIFEAFKVLVKLIFIWSGFFVYDIKANLHVLINWVDLAQFDKASGWAALIYLFKTGWFSPCVVERKTAQQIVTCNLAHTIEPSNWADQSVHVNLIQPLWKLYHALGGGGDVPTGITDDN